MKSQPKSLGRARSIIDGLSSRIDSLTKAKNKATKQAERATESFMGIIITTAGAGVGGYVQGANKGKGWAWMDVPVELWGAGFFLGLGFFGIGGKYSHNLVQVGTGLACSATAAWTRGMNIMRQMQPEEKAKSEGFHARGYTSKTVPSTTYNDNDLAQRVLQAA
jgi:hypothetical protein